MKLEQIFQDLSQADIHTIEESPGLLIFLPMLYVAWSDSVLSDKEVSAIRRKVMKQDWLSESERIFVSDRLQPDQPPSPKQLNEWLSVIKLASPLIPADSKQSLASLGLEITRLADQSEERWQSDSAQLALVQIEEALGVITTEALDDFLVEGPTKFPEYLETHRHIEVEQLSRILDGKSNSIKERLRQLLQTDEFKKEHIVDSDSYRHQVLKWCLALAKEGYGSLPYPGMYGGSDNMRDYFATMEILSHFDLSLMVKYGVQFGLFGGSIHHLGTEKHHKQYLNQVGTLSMAGCFGMTETGHGSNVRDIETTATYNPQSKAFIIHTPNDSARKDYIGNAALHGRLATVFAQLVLGNEKHGVSAFLVPLRDKSGNVLPGIRIEDCGEKLGLNGVDNGRIWFDQVTIPKDNLLDRFAQINEKGLYTSQIANPSKRFFTMLGTLVGGRIGIPLAALSATKSGLTIAIRYAHKRRQFGEPTKPEQLIIDYQIHQKRLMPLLANAYALDFALKYLTERYIDHDPNENREIEALAAGLKAYCTWNTTKSLQICREACGGNGYLWENKLAELKADTEIFTTFEGDNTVLMQLVAKSRLVNFKQEFNEIKFLGLVKYIAKQAATSLTEMNPIVTRKTGLDHITDTDFHLSAFAYRERHLLTRAAQRLKHKIDSGMNSFQAFNECQNHLVNLAHAYIERVILEQFVFQIDRVSNARVKETLTRLCQVFAMNLLNKHKGWYLENGYLEGVKTKAIRKQLIQLCLEVREDASDLVDAFNIPDKLLSAPIALNTTR